MCETRDVQNLWDRHGIANKPANTVRLLCMATQFR